MFPSTYPCREWTVTTELATWSYFSYVGFCDNIINCKNTAYKEVCMPSQVIKKGCSYHQLQSSDSNIGYITCLIPFLRGEWELEYYPLILVFCYILIAFVFSWLDWAEVNNSRMILSGPCALSLMRDNGNWLHSIQSCLFIIMGCCW